MGINKEQIENDIKVLCDQFIKKLNELKNDDLITREEYEEHIYLKKRFLESIGEWENKKK